MTRTLKKNAAAAVLLLGLVGGCGTTGSVDGSSPKGSNADSGGSASSGGKEESAKDAPMPKLGQTYTWDNGLSVKLSKPRPYQPSEYASFDKAPQYRQFEVTIVNKTGKVYDPNLFNLSVQSGDQEMGQVFDSPKLDGVPTTRILDGRQARFPIGFGITKPRDIVVQIETGDFDLEPVIFTS